MAARCRWGGEAMGILRRFAMEINDDDNEKLMMPMWLV
jgi:hypothetical protein